MNDNAVIKKARVLVYHADTPEALNDEIRNSVRLNVQSIFRRREGEVRIIPFEVPDDLSPAMDLLFREASRYDGIANETRDQETSDIARKEASDLRKVGVLLKNIIESPYESKQLLSIPLED